jgi:phosphoribosylamine--glycine ligase
MGPEGVVTSGGRVLGITALGDSLQESRDRAYEVAALISFDGAQMRGDIGMKTSDR